ncbi:stAR-related lipid transfer protein 3-like isoform X3 [Dreissena polymorpha]|uniref:stAR-related lipid transfer protein 3-like isoform X3 n=1 Tax=Dreissena polymorpha TaxID=45954 RepID=UPI002263E125|nr:stAR-related lipid transfer protein 3-like isoform X3 [Dreissena polymorpha]
MTLYTITYKKRDDLGLLDEEVTIGAHSRGNYQSISPTASMSASRDWDPLSGTMSPGRRTFCLLATFDLILTFILWVIYTQLIGMKPIWKAFTEQVGNYTFEKSLFDTVMIAATRFTFLMLAYALCRIRHVWVIALTTTMTCAYLLVKCFMFEFSDSVLGGKNPLSYVLLIICFVLAWVETWMLDFKVIPSERQIIRAARGHHRGATERDHLLPADTEQSMATSDNREFYTPEGSEDEAEQSTHGSNHHHHQHSNRHHKHGHHKHERKASDVSVSSMSSVLSSATMQSVRSLSPESENYSQLLEEAKRDVMTMFHDDSWKHESGTSLETGMVYSQNIKKYGRKIFKLRGVVNMAPKDLWEDMVQGLNESPKWNPTILESRCLQQIDETTQIVYNISAEAAGGLVSSRDFVNVRHWFFIEEKNLFVSFGAGCTHPDMPEQKKYVRGENGPGGWVFEAVEGEPGKCLFTWIVNSNLKGWLPQAAIDQAMGNVLTTYFSLLVKRYDEISKQRRAQSNT